MKKDHTTIKEKTRGIVLQKETMPSISTVLQTQRSITVHVGNMPINCSWIYGFYHHRNDFSSYHAHSCYQEIITLIGDCEFIVGEETLELKGANVLAMPTNVYHKLVTTENVLACSFFIDMNIDFTTRSLPEEIARSFLREAELVYKTHNYTIVSSYMSLILSYLISDKVITRSESVSDYAYWIDCFFNNNYMDDINLEALAEHLHVSVTHAHRLVQKHTGVTFTEELTVRRLKVANFLVKCRGMTLTAAAEAVGFRSYTGFWKARTKYKDKI